MRKVYVRARSKAELRRMIASGETIVGTEFNMFNPSGYLTKHILNELNEDVVGGVGGILCLPHCWWCSHYAFLIL